MSANTMTGATTCAAVFDVLPGCDPTGCQQAECLGTGGRWDDETCSCQPLWEDPLLLTLDGKPIQLTDPAGGVAFDLDGSGIRRPVAWTQPSSTAAFLVLDLDADGAITAGAELFGMPASAPRHQKPAAGENSLTLVAADDAPALGGNGDGLISAADAVFAQLRIWVDLNHDGVSQPGELLTLPQAGIASLELTAQPTGRRDRFGNVFRARVVVHLASGRETAAWDVFLAARLGSGGAPAAALAGGRSAGPLAAGLAALGAGLIALGLLSLGRTPPRRRLVVPVGLPPSAAARAGLTGLTALAVVLQWPAATFGQQAQDWQVVEYYDTDAVGSVRVVTDAQGQVVARHDFLPFGEELSPQHEPPDKRLYTGQERDFETGQDYFGYRQLRTDLGRFLAPDPITLVPRVVGAQGVNSYAYVRNNPLRLIDPNGLDAIDLDDVEPLDLYAPGDWGEDPGDTLASDGALNDATTGTDEQRPPDDSQDKLIAAQDAARDKPEFQPDYGGSTHCKQATAYVAKQVGAPMASLLDAKGNPLLAGDMASNLGKPGSGYRAVSADEAQQLANKGTLVIVAGPGHVATVRPDTGEKFPGKGVVIADVGRFNQVHRLEYAFKKADLPYVRFFGVK